jgi:hypothetical protein
MWAVWRLQYAYRDVTCSLRGTHWLYAVLRAADRGSGVTCRPDNAEARVRYQVSPCEFCSAQSGTVTDFPPSTSVFPCQYHSTNAPYPFIHLPPTLYNVSLPALQFSPVSTIPPTLHTHSFTYHPRYIIFLSQYFGFPLSVSFHQCSTLIFSLIPYLLKGQAGEA